MADETEQQTAGFPEYPPLDETGMVDLWQVEANLALTPAERIKQFEGFLELSYAIRRAGMKHYGDVPSTDPAAA